MTLPDVKSPIAAESAAKASIFAVPSIYKSLNSNPDAPKSLALSVEGTISLSNLPVAVMVSEVALPKSTSPFNTVLPATSTLPLASIAPVNVDPADTVRLVIPALVRVVTPTDLKSLTLLIPNTSNPVVVVTPDIF